MSEEINEQAASEARTEKMMRYGITCIPTDNFYYRGFHYTNLDDAVAQAIRDKLQSHQL